MLTIFSVPKPFSGHIGIIQRNAIRSWLLLQPACEVILCGNEPGIEEINTEFKTKWLPDVTYNEYGTPLLNSVCDQAQRTAKNRLLCYINADIIVMRDLVEAVKRVRFRSFLIVGQRWNVNISEPWDFDRQGWEDDLRQHTFAKGELHPPWGSDFFVFPKGSPIGKLPEFAVGRAGWDHWPIFRARTLGIPVIDVTKAVTVVHQNHGYDHVQDPKGYRSEGPEADWNITLSGQAFQNRFSLLDATHIVTPWGILPALGYSHIRRRLSMFRVLNEGSTPFGWLINTAGRVIEHLEKRRNSSL